MKNDKLRIVATASQMKLYILQSFKILFAARYILSTRKANKPVQSQDLYVMLLNR